MSINANIIAADGLSASEMQLIPMAKPGAVTGHLPSLDGLRAFSIALVLLAHTSRWHVLPGGFGVTVFFFISGFLISTLLIRERDRTGTISLRKFYLRRLIRLSPPLLVTLALGYGGVALGVFQGEIAALPIVSQLLFFFNYAALFLGSPEGVRGLSILWSLSVEEHFYFFWPVLFLALAGSRRFAPVLLLLLAGSLAWRDICFQFLGRTEFQNYAATDTRLDSLLYGCILALMVRNGWAARIFEGRWRAVPFLLVSCTILIASLIIRDPLFRATLRYTVQGIALMPVFYYSVYHSEWKLFKPFNFPIMQKVGIYSYTIYLVHFIIANSFQAHHISKPITVLGTAVLSYVWAAIVYRYIERPLRALRDRAAAT